MSAFPLLVWGGKYKLKRYLECGKIVTTHGLKGEVKVQPYADGPEFLCEFATLYFDAGRTPVEILSARTQRGGVVMKLAGVDDVDAARALRGRMLYLDRDAVELEPGEYFIQDLIGLDVVDIDTGHSYGKIIEVSPTGANDVYHIGGAGGKIHLIPAIKQVILSVDLGEGRMQIRPLEGLFDDED